MDWFRDFLSRKRLVLRSPITEKEMCGFSLACLLGWRSIVCAKEYSGSVQEQIGRTARKHTKNEKG